MTIGVFSHSELTDKTIEIHNQTENFIDIEAKVGLLNVDCSNANPESDNYYMSLDVFDGHEVFRFLYRRPISKEMCVSHEGEFQKILRTTKTFRLVGVAPTRKFDRPPKVFSKKDPASQKIVKWTSYLFVRLQVGEICKSYFSDECDLENNYWANTIPSFKPAK
jgi:hypothetical protein